MSNWVLGSAGLLALHSSMKYNKSITNLNLDEGCVVPTSEKVSKRSIEDSMLSANLA